MSRSVALFVVVLSLSTIVLFQNCAPGTPAANVARISASSTEEKGAATGLCHQNTINQELSFNTVMRGAAAPFDEKNGTVEDRSYAYPGNAFYASLPTADVDRPRMRDANGLMYRAYKGIWANYCTPIGAPNADCQRVNNPTKGNYIAPAVTIGYSENPQSPEQITENYQIRPMFRSYKNADNCTYAQIAAAMNQPAEMDAYIAKGDGLLKFVRHKDDGPELIALATERQFSPTSRGKILADVCLIDLNPKANFAGIVLDYEVWDRRTPSAVLTYVNEIRKIIDLKPAKQFYFYTNSLQQPGTRASNGVTEANANEIMQIVDGFSPIVWSGAGAGGYGLNATTRQWTFAESYEANLSILSDGGKKPLQLRKILPTVSLYDLSPAEARDLHDRIKARRFNGVKIWNNGVDVTPSCNNPAADEVIQCLVTDLGTCTGTTPLHQ